MSPEQARGDGPVDGRSDVYSLACMAYEMICGYPAVHRQLAEHSLAPSDVGGAAVAVAIGLPSIPHGISAAVSRALAKSPADRFATPGAFAAAMRDAMSGRRSRRAAASPAANNFHPPVLGSLRDRFFVLCKTVH